MINFHHHIESSNWFWQLVSERHTHGALPHIWVAMQPPKHPKHEFVAFMSQVVVSLIKHEQMVSYEVKLCGIIDLFSLCIKVWNNFHCPIQICKTNNNIAQNARGDTNIANTAEMKWLIFWYRLFQYTNLWPVLLPILRFQALLSRLMSDELT